MCVLQYVKTHYTGPRMVVVGAGAVNHNQLVELSAKAFENVIPASTGNITPVGHVPWTGTLTKIEDQVMHEAHVAIGVEGYGPPPLLLSRS